MPSPGPDALLSALLAPLAPYLLETHQGYGTQADPALSLGYWQVLCQVLANQHGLAFHPLTQPRLSVMLPGGHRLEALLGPTVASSLSVSIRRYRALVPPLEAFGLTGVLQERVVGLIRKGATVLISGGTSSGKTTLMNRLIQEIPLTQRVLVVEDTRELVVPHPNHQSYVLSRHEKAPGLDYGSMIDHLMRSRPDVILMGELSLANAYPLIRLLNSGHAGLMTTLHANSPELALAWAIPQNITLAGHMATGVTDFLYRTVDAVLQIHRLPTGERRLTHILFPPTHETIVL